MKMLIHGTVEWAGLRYQYWCDINKDQDRILSLEPEIPDDSFYENEDLMLIIEEKVLDDANERCGYTGGCDPIDPLETFDEYLSRMAKVWHPGEA